MKILDVGWGLTKASGVTTFVERTSEMLRKLGHVVDVIDTQKQPDVVSLEGYDIVHLHCLWKLHPYSVAVKQTDIPIVYSTHGMTAPWSLRHKWWKKLPAWWLYQKRDLKCAKAIHCTTEQELEWNKIHGFDHCFIVPLGTNEIPVDNVKAQNENDKKVLLFVGRIYPVKGLENLIRAWSEVISKGEKTYKNWKMRIVGPDEAGHKADLKSMVTNLRLQDSVEFPGPKFGKELSAEYENCDCLVLPSFTENFGVTVIDALAHGKPCITSKFTPWKEIQDRKCGWWVSNEPYELAETIRKMIDIGDDLRYKMGERGKVMVREKYTWDAVTNRILDVYQFIINNS